MKNQSLYIMNSKKKKSNKIIFVYGSICNNSNAIKFKWLLFDMKHEIWNIIESVQWRHISKQSIDRHFEWFGREKNLKFMSYFLLFCYYINQLRLTEPISVIYIHTHTRPFIHSIDISKLKLIIKQILFLLLLLS